MSWWVYLLLRVALFVHDKCVKHPYQYRKDLPIIAVAELCQQHCFPGYEYDAYENHIINLVRDDRHFLMNKLTEVIDRGFDSWATRICSAYKNVDDAKLNVYLWKGKMPSFVSFFRLVYQSTRLHQVFARSLILLMPKRTSPLQFSRNYRDHQKDLLRMLLMTRDLCRMICEFQT
jgi:hypothetical protein